MTKTETLKSLRIQRENVGDNFIVCAGSGSTYRAFSISTSEKAAKKSRADIRKNPESYGIH